MVTSTRLVELQLRVTHQLIESIQKHYTHLRKNSFLRIWVWLFFWVILSVIILTWGSDASKFSRLFAMKVIILCVVHLNIKILWFLSHISMLWFASFAQFDILWHYCHYQCFSSTYNDKSVAPGAGVQRAAPARRPAAQHEHSGQPERGQRDSANAAQPCAAAAENGLAATAQGD